MIVCGMYKVWSKIALNSYSIFEKCMTVKNAIC